MINKKVMAIGSVLAVSSTLAVVACSNTAPAQQARFAEVTFKPTAEVDLMKTLSASTGAGFSGALPTYENDGNENVTTRAGLRVRKSSVISAIKNNLGIDSENKVTNFATFATAVNELLQTADKLEAADFTDLDTVEITIGKAAGAATLFADTVASSKTSPVVTHEVSIVFHAKEGKTVGKQKTPRLTLKGMQRIRLTDYRRVDITTLEAVTNKPVIQLTSTKPTSVTLTSVAAALDSYFDISAATFATPFFPIWSEKEDGTPLYTIGNGFPVKHSLNAAQITDLQKLYKGKTSAFGDFPRPRIGRAIEKVVFTVPTTAAATAATAITPSGSSSDEYEVTLNLNMDFIKHWSWGITPYSQFVKRFTLPVTFKVKFGTAASAVPSSTPSSPSTNTST